MLGVPLILVSTAAYNGSAVLLAVTARKCSSGPSLILAVSRRVSGLFAIVLNLLGWGLEVAALSLISLTLARVLSAAGLGVLLVMTRWALQEPLGRRELLGVGFIGLGVAAVGFAPPSFGSASPELDDWALLLLILVPGIVLPYMLRVLRFLGFDVELGALRDGYVSTVVPIVLALHTIVPIICAPLLFDETWPLGLLPRALFSGGIFFTLLGTLLLSALSSHVLANR
jgi:hypothetical protein